MERMDAIVSTDNYRIRNGEKVIVLTNGNKRVIQDYSIWKYSRLIGYSGSTPEIPIGIQFQDKDGLWHYMPFAGIQEIIEEF